MDRWKLATAGIAVVAFTALSTGLTTAYVMRPAPAPAPVDASPTVARAVTTSPAPAPRPAAVVMRSVAPPVRRAGTTVPAAPPAVVTRPAAAPVATAPAGCVSTGDRVWRIAKPGAVGTAIGAGIGALGGAIADGGTAAGKGALIGGLAGAVLGSGYGAYQTKQECGTVFGGVRGVTPAPAVVPTPAAGARADEGLTVSAAR